MMAIACRFVLLAAVAVALLAGFIVSPLLGAVLLAVVSGRALINSGDNP